MKIKFKKWDFFQKGSPTVAYWFSMPNNLYRSSKFLTLTADQINAFIFLMSEVSAQNKGPILEVDYAFAQYRGISVETLDLAIKKLEEIQEIEVLTSKE